MSETPDVTEEDRAKAAMQSEIKQMIAEARAAAAAAPPLTPEEAVASLRDLTACNCGPAWTERGMHESDCCSDWREQVDILAAERATADQLRADLRALAEEWRYKGEFGWGPWQAGEGPDIEGQILDECAARLRAIVDGQR